MSKIGVMTIFHTYNYGAVLQAYATIKIISDLGYQCELINYDNDTFINDRKLLLKPTNVGNIIRNLRTIKNYKSQKKRINEFEQFINTLNKSKRQWINKCELYDTDYDILITGSDQTFSLYLRNNPEEMKAFFLPNCGEKKCISYAPSMGEKTNCIMSSDAEWIKKQLMKYAHLSVRDEKSANYIESLSGIRPKIVLDPTLLLRKEQWNQIIQDKKIITEKYIFFYTVLSDQWVVDYAVKISKKMGIKIIAVHNQTRYEINKGLTRIIDCGPNCFLSLIKNATYVLTTSFHATAFAIQYEKPLLVFKLGEGNRISSLLESLGMTEALVSENDNKELVFYNDYSMVKKKLENLRNNSMLFLRKALTE